jgi:hypothetical protein
MKRAGGFLSILLFWGAFSLIFIFGSLFIAPTQPSGLSLFVADSSRNILEDSDISGPNGGSGRILAAAKGSDTRPVLINRFLAKYRSPMAGTGKEFVAAADRYGLDWRLLPAIAFQESNLGKKIPKGSHNPFGWAIYEGANYGAYFNSWSEAINIVAARMNRDYLSNGFDTPETIVLKYTAKPTTSWVFAVNAAMEEISGTEY